MKEFTKIRIYGCLTGTIVVSILNYVSGSDLSSLIVSVPIGCGIGFWLCGWMEKKNILFR